METDKDETCGKEGRKEGNGRHGQQRIIWRTTCGIQVNLRDTIRVPEVDLRVRHLVRAVVVSVSVYVDWVFVADERWSGHRLVTSLSLSLCACGVVVPLCSHHQFLQ